MKRIIIGTAGHIDHGKTTLIKSLTGKNTDTLKEEIKRGISIDLGFTYFDLPSGHRGGIIDVPGHERFIKNMITGSVGVDIVLLVISATEGIMPQTSEHIEILNHLNIKDGIVVITKSSLVEKDYLELVIEEVENTLKNTFLENKKIIVVDSIEKTGIKTLIDELDAITLKVDERNCKLPQRINIDRVFSINGFGTVVTGTLSEGTLSVNDELTLYPQNKIVKIRNIQVYEKNVLKAYAGQRTALNLQNVNVNDLKRGDILAKTDTLIKTSIIDVKVNVSNSCEKIKMWDRVRVYIGTKEVLARFVPVNVNSFSKNETGYAQLRLEEPLFIKKGDLFILRRFSPLSTIGGGIVLVPNASRHKNISDKDFKTFELLEKGGTDTIVEEFIKKNDSQSLTLGKISTALSLTMDETKLSLNQLENVCINKLLNIYIHFETFSNYIEKVLTFTSKYHNSFPLRKGIEKSELYKKISPPFKLKYFDCFLNILSIEKILSYKSNLISINDFLPTYTSEELVIKSSLLKKLKHCEFTPPKVFDIVPENNITKEVINSLEGVYIVRLDKNTYIHIDFYNKAIEILNTLSNNKGFISLGDFRDATNSSRKFAILLLENFDLSNITKRNGESRILI